MTLLSRIKETAKKRGLSIEEVAKKASESSSDVKISRSSLYQWDKHEPKPSAVKAVADVLGVSVDYLLGNTDEMHPNKSEHNSAIDLRQVDDSERDELISANGQPISDSDWEIIKAVLAKYERHED